MMQPTIKNHTNPCLWTAHWNADFLELTLRGHRPGNSRQRRVHALSVKSDKIFPTIVENIHFDKNLFNAEITPDAMKEFVGRVLPELYDRYCIDLKDFTEPVVMDVEPVFSGLEQMAPYTTLLDVIQKQRLDLPQDKGDIAAFIVYHMLRSHSIVTSMVEWTEKIGQEKFEQLWFMKHVMSDGDHLFNLVMTFGTCHWTLYVTKRDTFPLNDSPILVLPDSIMVALSPRLLIEIDKTRRQAEDQLEVRQGIDAAKLDEFRVRTLGNTYREIIFSEPSLLQDWQQSREFRGRYELLKRSTNYNEVLATRGNSQLWMFNALSNRVC